jgi:1,4-alpha-glucan branching enzyme
LFKGKHYRLYEKLGAHLIEKDIKGVYFAVWAPSAASVSVVGDFNYWTGGENLLQVRWDPQVFGKVLFLYITEQFI